MPMDVNILVLTTDIYVDYHYYDSRDNVTHYIYSGGSSWNITSSSNPTIANTGVSNYSKYSTSAGILVNTVTSCGFGDKHCDVCSRLRVS